MPQLPAEPQLAETAIPAELQEEATTPAKTKPDSLTSLLTEVRQLIQSARRGVVTVVDAFQVITNFEVDRRIVEHEQKGAKRAAYGAELLKELPTRPMEEFGRGFTRSNFRPARAFFIDWESTAPPSFVRPVVTLRLPFSNSVPTMF